jgi:hypothetical protein
VSLQLVPLLGIESRPEWPVIVAAAVEIASRVHAVVPLAPISQPYTLFHAWGAEVGPALPADTIRVYVGPVTGSGEYGVGAPGGWSASGGSLPRSWGGFVGIDPAAIQAAGVDVATVTRHEIGHVLGAGHTTDPAALMHPHISPGVTKTLTHTDADLLDVAGWRADTAGVLPGYTRVYGHGDTANGWVMYPSDKVQQTFPSYVRVPDAGGWAFAPSYGVFAPA